MIEGVPVPPDNHHQARDLVLVTDDEVSWQTDIDTALAPLRKAERLDLEKLPSMEDLLRRVRHGDARLPRVAIIDLYITPPRSRDRPAEVRDQVFSTMYAVEPQPANAPLQLVMGRLGVFTWCVDTLSKISPHTDIILFSQLRSYLATYDRSNDISVMQMRHGLAHPVLPDGKSRDVGTPDDTRDQRLRDVLSAMRDVLDRDLRAIIADLGFATTEPDTAFPSVLSYRHSTRTQPRLYILTKPYMYTKKANDPSERARLEAELGKAVKQLGQLVDSLLSHQS